MQNSTVNTKENTNTDQHEFHMADSGKLPFNIPEVSHILFTKYPLLEI